MAEAPLLVRALNGERTERTPIWIMRQAGRYLPEYRAIRAENTFLEVCHDPELAAEVTLQPIRRFEMDGAVIFSDIMIPAEAMGCGIRFAPGPVLDDPIRDRAAVEALRRPSFPDDAPDTPEAIRRVRQALEGSGTAVIGFAAAPFTLFCYLVQGQGSKQFDQPRGLLYRDPETAHALLDRIAETTSGYLRAQIKAGAQVVQLFDSWAGLLNRSTFRTFALPYVEQILADLASLDVPRIYFAVGADHLLETMPDLEAEAFGIDWRTPLSRARSIFGSDRPLQGNLDPCALLGTPTSVAESATSILREAGSGPHVFNLGHGITKETPVENVTALVETVKGWKKGTDAASGD